MTKILLDVAVPRLAEADAIIARLFNFKAAQLLEFSEEEKKAWALGEMGYARLLSAHRRPFRTRDGQRVDPLTVSDTASRT